MAYKVCAAGPDGVAETQPFTFDVPGWQHPQRVDLLEQLSDGVVLRFAFADPTYLPVIWTVRIDRADHILYEVTPALRASLPTDDVLQAVTVEVGGLRLTVWLASFRLEVREAGGTLLPAQTLPELLLLPFNRRWLCDWQQNARIRSVSTA